MKYDNVSKRCSYSIPGLAGTKYLVYHSWAIWLIVRTWVWDSVISGAQLADEMDLGKTFTSVAAAIICKLLTKKIVVGLPLPIMWGVSLDKLVNMA